MWSHAHSRTSSTSSAPAAGDVAHPPRDTSAARASTGDSSRTLHSCSPFGSSTTCGRTVGATGCHGGAGRSSSLGVGIVGPASADAGGASGSSATPTARSGVTHRRSTFRIAAASTFTIASDTVSAGSIRSTQVDWPRPTSTSSPSPSAPNACW
jgi:hypothetical protein